MIIMVATHAGGLVHMLAGAHPGRVGWLISPGEFKEPRRWLPYALDNGKYTTWSNNEEWDEDKFFALLDRCKLSRFKPRWVLVPDEIGDWEKTLQLWRHYETRLRQYKYPLAFAVQDGMTPTDIPKSADLIFIGGTTNWKWRNAALFAASFPRVHIGRVNWIDKLEYCERLEVESVDGTGFFRGGEESKQAQQLVRFIAGERTHQLQPSLL